jgi:hypothetical protein
LKFNLLLSKVQIQRKLAAQHQQRRTIRR